MSMSAPRWTSFLSKFFSRIIDWSGHFVTSSLWYCLWLQQFFVSELNFIVLYVASNGTWFLFLTFLYCTAIYYVPCWRFLPRDTAYSSGY